MKNIKSKFKVGDLVKLKKETKCKYTNNPNYISKIVEIDDTFFKVEIIPQGYNKLSEKKYELLSRNPYENDLELATIYTDMESLLQLISDDSRFDEEFKNHITGIIRGMEHALVGCLTNPSESMKMTDTHGDWFLEGFNQVVTIFQSYNQMESKESEITSASDIDYFVKKYLENPASKTYNQLTTIIDCHFMENCIKNYGDEKWQGIKVKM